jgi:hypothetical protein
LYEQRGGGGISDCESFGDVPNDSLPVYVRLRSGMLTDSQTDLQSIVF